MENGQTSLKEKSDAQLKTMIKKVTNKLQEHRIGDAIREGNTEVEDLLREWRRLIAELESRENKKI